LFVRIATLLMVSLAAATPAASQGAPLNLAGQVLRPGPHDTTALARFGADTLTHAVRGTPVLFRGVLLWRLLQDAGLATDSAIKSDALRKVVIATARDGYRITLSIGELDPSLGATPVLIAWERDGQPLRSDRGPYQLVIPSDRRPARSMYQLERLEVVSP
jgi:hypothetical protein